MQPSEVQPAELESVSALEASARQQVPVASQQALEPVVPEEPYDQTDLIGSNCTTTKDQQ